VTPTPEVVLGPVATAIRARRTNRKFDGRPVRLLESAVQAPQHHLTEPWRFWVLDGGDSPRRRQIADIAAEDMARSTPGLDEARLEEKRQSIINVPALVFVFSVQGKNATMTQENYAAAACAVQNLLLAAHEEGLATNWTTGGLIKSDELRSLLGVDPEWQVVSMVHVGYADPAKLPAHRERKSAGSYTVWLADQD
jgi:nitroreductase